MRRCLLVLACLLLVAGCANVPLESQPVVPPGNRAQQQEGDVPDPANDIDPLSLVRGFIGASALPGNNSAAARVYLDDPGRRDWKPAQSLTVIQDTFNTVPDSPQPDPNVLVVDVHGIDVGTLGADNAFTPYYQSFDQPITVRKQQATGQWRIVNAPTNLLVTEADFSANYVGVPVNFYSPDTGTFVPDLRYVVAKPQSGLPGRVIDQLLQGPSDGLSGAVKNYLADPVTTETNVKSADDGSLVVPLTGLSGASIETRNLIAAQVVLSLHTVMSTRIKLLADGAPLVPGHPDWRYGDLPAYDTATSPSQDLLGLMTVDGRIRSLGDGNPVPGPAGTGAYHVTSAGQSMDGHRLAVVESVPGGRYQLRIGDFGHDLPTVDITGSALTRPTWKPAPGGESGEVWTVIDGATVARMVFTSDGHWSRQAVNSAQLSALGNITDLRFSRDGARVAAVVDKKLVVAAVVRNGDSVSLVQPRILQPNDLQNVVDVDWFTQDTLIVATGSAAQPVVKVLVDGQRMDPFNSSNLSPPVTGVAAAPSHQIVVADGVGLWNASELGEVWRPQPHSTAGADPFYPG